MTQAAVGSRLRTAPFLRTRPSCWAIVEATLDKPTTQFEPDPAPCRAFKADDKEAKDFNRVLVEEKAPA
jgi:hypothetical protein